MKWIILVLAAALSLGACKYQEEETGDQRKAREADEIAERALFSDPVKAEAELDRRLRNYLEVRKGVLVVRDGELERDQTLASSRPRQSPGQPRLVLSRSL